MKKPIIPTSIKFTTIQRQFLKRRAKEQKHGKLSHVVIALVDREMQGAAHV